MTSRTSISLPDDLKRRMDAVGARVNWSKVACLAFEQKLADIALSERKHKMKDVIQRLRASKATGEHEALEASKQAGRLWAAKTASWTELTNLNDNFGDWTDGDWDDFCDCVPDAYGHIGALMEAINPGNWDRSIAEGFGDQFLDKKYPSPREIQGFCLGAFELLAEVEDKL